MPFIPPSRFNPSISSLILSLTLENSFTKLFLFHSLTSVTSNRYCLRTAHSCKVRYSLNSPRVNLSPICGRISSILPTLSLILSITLIIDSKSFQYSCSFFISSVTFFNNSPKVFYNSCFGVKPSFEKRSIIKSKSLPVRVFVSLNFFFIIF